MVHESRVVYYSFDLKHYNGHGTRVNTAAFLLTLVYS